MGSFFDINSFMDAIISGLISGSLYAATALGLTIIYGVSRVFNFGHGIVAVMGAYLVWTFLQTSMQLGLLLGIIASAVIMFIFGVLVYRYTMNPLIKKPGWDISTVLFLLGGGILLENVLLQIFGPRVKSIPVIVEGSLKLGPIEMTWNDLILMVTVITAIIILNLFFKLTRTGQAM